MISLNNCTGSCNILSPKLCILKEAKDIYVTSFNMKTNKNEVKAMTEHFSCDCKCKFNSTTRNSKQKWNNKTSQCECKSYCKCKKDYSWNRSTCICEKSKWLKGFGDTSVTEYDEIIIVMNTALTKKINPKATKIDKYYSNKCYE